MPIRKGVVFTRQLSTALLIGLIAQSPSSPFAFGGTGGEDCLSQAIAESLVPRFVDPAVLRTAEKPTQFRNFKRKAMRGYERTQERNTHHYFESAAEREPFRIYAYGGRLYDSRGQLLNHSDSEAWIAVMDSDGYFYMRQPWHELSVDRKFSHSSFLGGRPVAFAGEIRVSKGVIASISNGSGHYAPGPEHLEQAVGRLREMGVGFTPHSIRTHRGPVDLRSPDEIFRVVRERDPKLTTEEVYAEAYEGDKLWSPDPTARRSAALQFDSRPIEQQRSALYRFEKLSPELAPLVLEGARTPWDLTLDRILRGALESRDPRLVKAAAQQLVRRTSGPDSARALDGIREAFARSDLPEEAISALCAVFRGETEIDPGKRSLLEALLRGPHGRQFVVLQDGLSLAQKAAADASLRPWAVRQLTEIKGRLLDLRSDPRQGELAERYLRTFHPHWLETPVPGAIPKQVDPLIRQIAPGELERMRIRFLNGSAYDANGRILDGGSGVEWIYVMDSQGSLYVAKPQVGRFHHSSFLRGAPVAGAGTIQFQEGKILRITRSSGHYKPSEALLRQVVDRLREQGVEVPRSAVSVGIPSGRE